MYLNVQAPTLVETEEQEFISVLIADFDNQTKDPLFDGSVEEVLTIGIEGASFITSFNRNSALSIANELNEGSELDEERARLVAVREGINLVLLGTIALEDNEYLLTLKAVEPREGTVLAEVDATAENKLAVLQAVGTLATQLRSEFGDAEINEEELTATETFSASSLEAMQLYVEAQSLAQQGNHEAAVGLYEQAIGEDDQFGRAYSGWALSAFQLGQAEKAEELWEKTLPLMQGMTDREKYRTLGLYYSRVSRNYAKAIENYEQLVTDYPADNVARNNLAVTYFLNRKFKEALRVGGEAAELYPNERTVQSNYALYSMYAGDFVAATAASEKLVSQPDVYYKAYLPLAMAYLNAGDFKSANDAYLKMGELGLQAKSMSLVGLADAALTAGDVDEALRVIRDGIERDELTTSSYFLASKYVLLAEALLVQGDLALAQLALDKAASASSGVGPRVAAALLYIQIGSIDQAEKIAGSFKQRLQAEERAYADLIEGSIALKEGKVVEAVDFLLASVGRTDTWLARLALGKAYMKANAHAEALSEFEACEKRIGEVTAVFLDDIPSYHRSVELNHWLAEVRTAMGMKIEGG